MRAYVDADILIWHLRGSEKALQFLQRIRAKPNCELWVGAMQRAEVVFFMRPNEESSTLALLSQFATAPVGQEIVDRAAGFYRRWNPSHGLDVNDALLAATVAESGGVIYCLNKKHYPMTEMLVEKPW